MYHNTTYHYTGILVFDGTEQQKFKYFSPISISIKTCTKSISTNNITYLFIYNPAKKMSPRPLKLSPKALLVEMMEHKEIDHNAAHLQWGNQFLHLTSSIMMLGVYYLMADWALGNRDLKLAALVTIAAQTMRQGGHFFIEGNATEKEKLKIGYTTRMKQIAVYIVIPMVFLTWYFNFTHLIDGYSLALATYGVIISYRILWLSMYGDHILQGWVWWWKIFTDMFTDIHLYGPTAWGETAPKMYEWTTPELERNGHPSKVLNYGKKRL